MSDAAEKRYPTPDLLAADIVEIRQETPEIRSFLLDCGEPVEHLPGQWLEMHVCTAEGWCATPFSITSTGGGRYLQVAVKAGNWHPVTSYLSRDVAVGDRVWLSPAQGRFIYRRGMGERVVLIGGGVGVTPLIGILRHIDRSEPGIRTTLLYSVTRPEEVLFADELEETAARNEAIDVIVTVTRDVAGWKGRTGRVDPELLMEAGAAPDAVHFVCGPPPMVRETVALLRRMGIPEERIIHEQ